MSNKNFHLQGIDQSQPLVIREGEAPRISVYGGYRYSLEDTDSLIAFVRKYSTPENGIIVYGDSGIGCNMDSSIQDRRQDFIQYSFEDSFAAQEWGGIIKGSTLRLSIREFVYFLEHRAPDEIGMQFLDDLIDCVKHMKYAVTTETDHSFDDRNNFTVAIKVGENQGNVKIPKRMYVNLELIKGSGFLQELEIEIETILAKGPTEGGTAFELSCPNWQRYWLNARENEVAKVRSAFPDWLIVAGKKVDKVGQEG